MKFVLILIAWFILIDSCQCGEYKSESVKSEKDLIDLEMYGVAFSSGGFVYLLNSTTLCGVYREFKESENIDNDKRITYIIKLYYSVTTVSTPITLNITKYSLDEENSYIEFDEDSVGELSRYEGCIFGKRKYKMNEIRYGCKYISSKFNTIISSVIIPEYFDNEKMYRKYNEYDYNKYSIDDITYKMNSGLRFYRPKLSQILFDYYECGSRYYEKCYYSFYTSYSNGYMQQSIKNDSYQFIYSNDVGIKESDPYDILIYKNEGYGNMLFAKLNEDSERICYSIVSSNRFEMNDRWKDFYLYECMEKKSKSEVIEKFKSVYNQFSSSFDENFDLTITPFERELRERNKEKTQKKELVNNNECYYKEIIDNEDDEYEGFFVDKNEFIIIHLTNYYGVLVQYKLVIPITDPKQISLKEMNCKESEIQKSNDYSKKSFEEYYGDCDIDNNEKLRYDIRRYYRGNYSFSSNDKTMSYNYKEQIITIHLKTTNCDIFNETIPRITLYKPDYLYSKTLFNEWKNTKYLYIGWKCFEYNDTSTTMNCVNKYFYMIEGIEDKYFIGRVEFFNLSGYDFESDDSVAIEKVKSQYKSYREENYNKIIGLLSIDDDNKDKEIEYNIEDNYDELYKGNGYTDGRSILISDDKIMLFSEYSGNYRFVYSYTSSKEGNKTIITLGDIDEEHTYLNVYYDIERDCRIELGKYNYKTIKEKCPYEYQVIFNYTMDNNYIRIPSYIENNKLYYDIYSADDVYELSNADIHYKIDHPLIKEYPAKQYEMWSWHKIRFENGAGYILQTNTSILKVYKYYYNNRNYYNFNHYNYSFYPNGSISTESGELFFFHLVENDSRICFGSNKDYDFFYYSSYLANECYKVRKAEDVLEQFKTDFPKMVEETIKYVEEYYYNKTKRRVRSTKKREKKVESQLKKEEEKGYYYEYYYNYYYSYEDKYYRGYFITSNRFTIIYQYGTYLGDYNKDICQIKLIFDITNKNNLNIYDFNCELSEIELPCSGEEDCPNSKKSFKDEFNNCEKKEEMNVYLNDLVDTNIEINIENKYINITKNEEIFLIIPLEERDLSVLEEEVLLITKNTRGIQSDKSFDVYVKNERNDKMVNIVKVDEGLIQITTPMNDSSEKGFSMIICDYAKYDMDDNYFYIDFHSNIIRLKTFDNANYYIASSILYHDWINIIKFPFITDFKPMKKRLLSNLTNQLISIYSDITHEYLNITIEERVDLYDKGNIVDLSLTLFISMIMIIILI